MLVAICTLPDGLLGTADGLLGALVTLMVGSFLTTLLDETIDELLIGDKLRVLIRELLSAAEGVIMDDTTVVEIKLLSKPIQKLQCSKIPGYWIGGMLNSPQHPSPGIF